MKKFAIFIFMMLLVLLLVSCGSEADPTSPSNGEDATLDVMQAVDDALQEAEEFNSFSEEAVAYYFEKAAGLQLENVKPDWDYTVGAYSAYADSPESGYGHGVIAFTKADGEVSDELYDAWLNKVFNATAAVSQDGFNCIGYEFASDGEDALAQTTLEEAIGGFMSGWAFRYNDKMMVVYVDREYDNDKESEIGSLFFYDGVSIDIGVGLQKNWSDTMDEAEQYFEENADEISDALSDYLS